LCIQHIDDILLDFGRTSVIA